MGNIFKPYELRHESHAPLTDVECSTVGDILWENFLNDFKPPSNIKANSQVDLIKTALLQMIKYQGADAEKSPRPLLGFMDDREIINLATHLYVAIQLVDDLNELINDNYVNATEYAEGFLDSELLCKAFDEANPYVLRFHVFALHNRLFDLLENRDTYHDDWKKRCDVTFHEARRTLQKVESLVILHPTFAHFLLGYCHYTLAMGTFGPKAIDHWEAAHQHFELTEEAQNTSKRDHYILTLGQGIYKDMPFNTLNEVKMQIREKISEGRQH